MIVDGTPGGNAYTNVSGTTTIAGRSFGGIKGFAGAICTDVTSSWFLLSGCLKGDLADLSSLLIFSAHPITGTVELWYKDSET